jgi:rod shape-determining protein MreC
MIYPQFNSRNNRRKKKSFFVIVGFVCLMLVVSLLSVFAPHFFSSVVQVSSKPFAFSRDALTASVGDVFGSLKSKEALVSENSNLEQQLALLNTVEDERDMYKSENQDLEGLLGNGPTTEKTVLGRVLEEPGFSPYDTAVIDVGTHDGVENGDMVYADSATVLGYVSSAGTYTSTIVFYSSSGQKLNVFIGSSTVEASVAGLGGGNLEVELPRNTDVHQGDTVVLADDPEQLIGTVQSINTTSADSFEQVLITEPVNIQSLKYLFVAITRPDAENSK